MKARTVLLLALLAAHVARAATITVTSTADSGPGSMRNALTSAMGGDTIDATGISGTILLTTGELLVANSVTITGPGPHHLAVDGNGTSHVFHIGSNNVVNISGLTITNGNHPEPIPGLPSSGGGIYIDTATLVISNCAVSRNGGTELTFGGGIFNFRGTLTIQDTTVSGNAAGGGGAIYNWDGDLTLSRTTISSNNAVVAGGIYNTFGDLTVKNCIISDNYAVDGGGIESGYGALIVENSTFHGNTATGIDLEEPGWTFGGGGAISTEHGIEIEVVIIRGCTFDDNNALDGGALHNTSPFALENCTFNNNRASRYGGAIYNEGGSFLKIRNTTLAGNHANGQGGGIFNLFYPDFYITNSIVASNTAPLDPDVTGIAVGTFNFIGGDPTLGPLADNGGPTRTMALLPGSPCINAGDINFVGPPDSDQRGPGFARVVDGRVDIGAFEVQPDEDRDGVPDSIDKCLGTSASAVVDATGCSIDQLAPCGGPAAGGAWKNHGEYVSTVAKTAQRFLAAGLITQAEMGSIVATAAQADCGKKPKTSSNK